MCNVFRKIYYSIYPQKFIRASNSYRTLVIVFFVVYLKVPLFLKGKILGKIDFATAKITESSGNLIPQISVKCRYKKKYVPQKEAFWGNSFAKISSA